MGGPTPVDPARSIYIIRSYHGESTGSHPNSEVKHHWACSVLRWGTTWESQVSNVFAFCLSMAKRSSVRRARAGRRGDPAVGAGPMLTILNHLFEVHYHN